jgi:RNA polymerase sigma-70 factor (ECF subfamily)
MGDSVSQAIIELRSLPSEPQTSFADFYRMHHPGLIRFLQKRFWTLDVEEVAQETMFRAYQRFDEVATYADPGPWLRVVARNIARDLCRVQQRHPSEEISAAHELPDRDARSLDDHMWAEENRRRLNTALRRLPPQYRGLLLMRVDGADIRDIAELLGVTDNAVRQQLWRARRALASAFA